MQIIVLGMHRSGTSAVSRILNMMGAYFAPEGTALDANEYNPKGYWERKDVLTLNDSVLQSDGSIWCKVAKFNLDNVSDQALNQFSSQAKRILRNMDAHRPWVMKDPRFSLTLPLWRSLLEVPVCILVYRHPIQVAQSLKNRDLFPLHVGIALWERYNLSAIRVCQDVTTVIVSYQKLIEEPVVTVKALYEDLAVAGVEGLRIPRDQEILSFIDPKLCRHQGDSVLEEGFLNNQQQSILAALEGLTLPQEVPALSSGSLGMLNDFEEHFDHQIKLEKLAGIAKYEQPLTLDKRLNQVYDAIAQNKSVLESSFNEVSEELERRNSKLADVNKELSGCKSKANNLQDSFGQKVEELVRRNSELADVNKELSGYKSETNNLQDSLDQKVEELEGRNSELADVTKELSDYKSETNNLQDSLDQKVEELERRNSELADISKELSGYKSKANNLQDSFDQKVEELERRNSELVDISKELSGYKSVENDLTAFLSQKTNELQQLQDQIKTAQENIAWAIESQINDIQKLSSIAEQLYEHLEKTFSSITWKTGFAAAEVIRKLTWREPEILIEERVNSLMDRFSNWKMTYKVPDLPDLSTLSKLPSPQKKNDITNKTPAPAIYYDEEDTSQYEEIQYPDITPTEIKLIAFYLPQFHPIPENDEWWGKGFTEWTNVTRALPQYEGHYQPRLPGELGFYDLRLPEIQKRQIELAKQYGIYGFCYHHYWFGGKRLLKRPFNQVLANPEMDLPFCLCWANENWSRRWDGMDEDILISQQHNPEDDIAFIEDIEPALRDKRYIRVSGKPLLIVYRVDLLPDAQATADRWRQFCKESGIGDIYLVAAQSFGITDPRPYGFDAAVEFPPHHVYQFSPDITHEKRIINPHFDGKIFDFPSITAYYQNDLSQSEYPLYRCVMPSWDNTARKGKSAHVYTDSTPKLYEDWLISVCKEAAETELFDEKLIFINAWNEWAEGAYLEPDRNFGYAYLNATHNALTSYVKKEHNASSKISLPLTDYRPAISIIVPNFNHQKFLEKRLDSIYRQDYSDIEVILLDDASTDESSDVLNRYFEKYKYNTRLIINDNNSGCVFTQWLKGIKEATGDLIWIAESDDYCDDNFLSALLPYFKDESVSLAYSKTQFVDSEGTPHSRSFDDYVKIIDEKKWKQDYVETAFNEVRNALGVKNTIPNVSAVIFRKPRDLELFRREEWLNMRICGDWILYLNILAGGKIAYSTGSTSYFRLHADSSSQKTYSQDVYYTEHALVASEIARKYKVPQELLLKNRGIIRDFHRKMVSAGDKRFDQLFNKDKLLEAGKDRKLNIVISILSFTHGGAEIMPIRLANLFKELGYAITVHSLEFLPEEKEVRDMLRNDIPVVRTDDVTEFAGFLGEFGIDVLNTHTQLCQDLYCETLNVFPEIHKHICHIGTLHGGYETMDDKYLRKHIPDNDNCTDHWTYVAEKNKDLFSKFGVKLDGKSTKIYNGIHIPDITRVSRGELKINEDSFVLCLVSRAIPEKGWLEAIEIVNETRKRSGADIHLILVGDGPIYKKLEKERITSHIHLIGYSKNPMGYFKISNMGLLPSTYVAESFPLSVVECLTVGKPVMASNVGEIMNMLKVDQGYAGDVFDLEEGKVPIKKVAQILCRNIEDKKTYSQALQLAKQCMNKFNLDDIALSYLKVYEKSFKVVLRP